MMIQTLLKAVGVLLVLLPNVTNGSGICWNYGKCKDILCKRNCNLAIVEMIKRGENKGEHMQMLNKRFIEILYREGFDFTGKQQIKDVIKECYDIVKGFPDVDELESTMKKVNELLYPKEEIQRLQKKAEEKQISELMKKINFEYSPPTMHPSEANYGANPLITPRYAVEEVKSIRFLKDKIEFALKITTDQLDEAKLVMEKGKCKIGMVKSPKGTPMCIALCETPPTGGSLTGFPYGKISLQHVEDIKKLYRMLQERLSQE